MDVKRRMSPLTALFLGIWIVGGIGIASGTAITLHALSIIDGNVSTVVSLVEGTIDDLPALVESLPDAVGTALNDRREPEYADRIQVNLDFVADDRSGRLRPTLTIRNVGSEVVSLLAVRAAALEDGRVPVAEWTEVVATPLAIADEWRGPLMPGATRHVVVGSPWRSISPVDAENITGAVEISELRVWNGNQSASRAAADASSAEKLAAAP